MESKTKSDNGHEGVVVTNRVEEGHIEQKRQEQEMPNENKEEENWTVVKKKGKNIMVTPQNTNTVLFPNPFTHLRIGEGPAGGESSGT